MAFGLRDKKKVAGVAVRGSRDGDEGWSEGLRENGRSGIGLIMKAFPIGKILNVKRVNKKVKLSTGKVQGDHVMVSHVIMLR